MVTDKGFVIPDGITADAIILWHPSILLVRRKNAPYKDKWALPGGFFEPEEEPWACCQREVLEETGLDISLYERKPCDVVSYKGRDPRGWIISVPFLIKLPYEFNQKIVAGDDASSVAWMPLEQFVGQYPELLAFDHNDIIQDAL